MAENKRYFWLKLKEDFFQNKAIKKLRRIAGGDTYTVIYLKMMLRSIKTDGKLYFEHIENNFYEELALDLDEDIENVKITLAFLQANYLIEVMEEDTYSMPEAICSIGSESSSAERVRNHRNRQKALQCNGDVTDVKRLGNVEKRREREEKEKENNSRSKPDAFFSARAEIMEYFNKKTGRVTERQKFDPESIATKSILNKRLKEGHTVDEFKTIIDNKYAEWHDNPKFKCRLVPETLFAQIHWDTYLKQGVEVASNTTQIDYSNDSEFIDYRKERFGRG